jgi:hypothetical protein
MSTPSTGGLTRKIIQRVIQGVVAFLTLLTLLMMALVYHFNKPAKSTSQPAHSQVSPVAPTAPTVTVRPWTSRTFDIPENGLRLWLEQGAATYPKLGIVEITTPSGRVIKDTPGIDKNGGYESAGFYSFKADPPESKRKIEIYNRW